MSWRVHNLVKSKVIGKTINPQGKSCSAVMRKIVLLAYADVAAHDGSGVFVAKKTIAAEQEIDRTSVIAATQSLIDDGILVVDESRYDGGRRPGRGTGFTFVYRIVISAVQALPDAVPGKCRNSDTLDDATIDGDELAEQYLKARRRPVSKSRQVSASPTLQVSESGRSSVGHSDTNYPYRTNRTPAHDSPHRRADPEYAREGVSGSPPTDPRTVRIERQLSQLRIHLATANRGEEITSGDYAGMLPRLAAAAINDNIARLEGELRKGSAA